MRLTASTSTRRCAAAPADARTAAGYRSARRPAAAASPRYWAGRRRIRSISTLEDGASQPPPARRAWRQARCWPDSCSTHVHVRHFGQNWSHGPTACWSPARQHGCWLMLAGFTLDATVTFRPPCRPGPRLASGTGARPDSWPRTSPEERLSAPRPLSRTSSETPTSRPAWPLPDSGTGPSASSGRPPTSSPRDSRPAPLVAALLAMPWAVRVRIVAVIAAADPVVLLGMLAPAGPLAQRRTVTTGAMGTNHPRPLRFRRVRRMTGPFRS